eukprot:45840-Eustigmatos_ZCMA.PRE.1
MELSAPGLDSPPLQLLRLFADKIVPRLTRSLSRALAELPPQLRTGETVFFTKPPGAPATGDPGKYRPITLLPLLVRMLHKIVDSRLREIIFGDPLLHPRVAFARSTMYWGQAGFMRRRSAIEQAH